MDTQQKNLIALLEDKADECQLRRNNANDLFDIASFRASQSNVFIFGNHVGAFALALSLSFAGIYVQLVRDEKYGAVIGSGCGLSAVLVSSAMDDSRQRRMKRNLVLSRKKELEEIEEELTQCVNEYREEEEIGWLMLALNLTRDEFLTLRSWMSDPRRDMKDSILKALDVLLTHYMNTSLESVKDPVIVRQRSYRDLRQQLLSDEIQLTKAAFMQRVSMKHRLLREEEVIRLQEESEGRIATTSVVGGTATGLAAGVAAAGIGSGIAGTLGASRNAANLVGALGGAAAVVGVGLVAAGAITEKMRQMERERQVRETQNFKEAFLITDRISSILFSNVSSEISVKLSECRRALQVLDAFKDKELKTQDEELKSFVDFLRASLKTYLREPQDYDVAGRLFKFFGGFFE